MTNHTAQQRERTMEQDGQRYSSYSRPKSGKIKTKVVTTSASKYTLTIDSTDLHVYT